LRGEDTEPKMKTLIKRMGAGTKAGKEQSPTRQGRIPARPARKYGEGGNELKVPQLAARQEGK